jgi:UDP-N-acetylmuramyl pentapeptide phosphotransferase/UDP-N-acetylglucosamine-1-phosphate transferase
MLALILAKSGRLSVWQYLAPVFIPAVWLTLQDRRARIMLGDAGSNVLGAVFGVAVVYETGLIAKVALVLLMIAVHLYSEKHSISRLIENNGALRRIDRLLGER